MGVNIDTIVPVTFSARRCDGGYSGHAVSDEFDSPGTTSLRAGHQGVPPRPSSAYRQPARRPLGGVILGLIEELGRESPGLGVEGRHRVRRAGAGADVRPTGILGESLQGPSMSGGGMETQRSSKPVGRWVPRSGDCGTGGPNARTGSGGRLRAAHRGRADPAAPAIGSVMSPNSDWDDVLIDPIGRTC